MPFSGQSVDPITDRIWDSDKSISSVGKMEFTYDIRQGKGVVSNFQRLREGWDLFSTFVKGGGRVKLTLSGIVLILEPPIPIIIARSLKGMLHGTIFNDDF